MSNNPSVGSSTTGTSAQPIDYLGYLGGLTGLPFDPNTVINGLLQADQIPIQNLQTHIKNIQINESIYKSIGSDVAALQTAAFNLTLHSNTQANAATSSNTNIATAAADPTAQAGSYAVTVNSLATATTAASTSGIGRSIDATASTTPLNALDLRAAPTAGTFSIVVDGALQTIAVDPTKPLVDPAGTTPPRGALSRLQAAIAAGIGDPGATVSVGVTNDKVSINITGATAKHTLSLGAQGDTSNVLSLLNLSTAQGSTSSGSLALTSSSNVGVASPSAPLSAASLGTALSSPTGAFSIDGVSIAWNAGSDSLNNVINRINSSAAGVTAQYNSVTDQLVLTNKATGQSALNLQDTSGNFLAAMNLAPGMTTAQTLGANASLTVNGTTVSSTSNTVTNAVPGLSITAGAVTPAGGAPTTLTVATDTATVTKNVQAFIDAANKTLSDVNTTQQKDPTSGTYSQLFGDSTLIGLKNYLLTTITGRLTPTGAYQSLQDVGVTTGRVGSAPGTTGSLSFDTAKFAAALAANPGQVASLFNGTTGTSGFSGVAQTINTYLFGQTNPLFGPFAQYQKTGDTEIKSMQSRITNLNNTIAQQRKILVAQFQAMSTVYGNLSAESGIFNSSSSSSLTSGH